MKKLIVLCLAFAMCMGLFAGCGLQKGNDDATRMVVDTWGREVEIPEKVEKIVCLGSGAPRMAA